MHSKDIPSVVAYTTAIPSTLAQHEDNAATVSKRRRYLWGTPATNIHATAALRYRHALVVTWVQGQGTQTTPGLHSFSN
ncbi:hypothetical protein BTJ68_05623 [Hortaea werneckii EXF-2000]|uniref:Uncharacterized protein n=1 Tax=Hortaea werneckii EXF-2000 TaxID=1157616 RepID=A0A1Z5TBP9_HORWE|nr:hypothetical protein BTJ68_05623 [Hortaea werneckii EXF-2000]